MKKRNRFRPYIVLPTVLIALLILYSAIYAQWFEDGTPVCVTAGDQLSPQIASVSRGETVIAWRGGGGVVVQRINAFGDLLWDTDGVVLCHGSTKQHTLLADRAGGTTVTWSYRRGRYFEVYVQRLTRFGRPLFADWGLDICTADGHKESPAITPAGNNEYIVVWQDERGIDTDIYAQKVSSGGVLLWDEAGLPVCAEAGAQESPVTLTDGEGGVIVVWVDTRGVGMDIYAQRIDGDGTPLWTLGGIPLCAAAGDQNGVKIVRDGSGGAIAVWQDARAGDLDIYAQRVSADGSLLWGTDGVPVCVVTADQSQPTVVPDGSGGVIAAWSDMRDADADIMAQRIDASGTELWQAGGIPLCTLPGDQTIPYAAFDGVGGAIVAWQNERGDNSDIHAQRISATGGVVWKENGVVVCNAPCDQLSPRIAPDGVGGAFMPWEDMRSGESDIYIQRITGNGKPAEPPVSIHSATLGKNGVTVKWTVSSDAELLRYSVWRSEGTRENYRTIMVSIERKGNSFSFTDEAFLAGIAYTYRIEYRSGNRSYLLFTTEPVCVPAEKHPKVQSHPNPFNPSTTISYELPARGHVRLDIYDAAGRRIVRLVGAVQDEGLHRIVWDGRDSNGSQVASGIYFSRLTAGGSSVTRKMVLVR